METLYLVFVVFGGTGLVLGAVFGGFLRPAGARLLVALAAGVALAGLILALHANTHEIGECHDCEQGLGGAYHPLEAFGAVLNSLGWIVGVFVGMALSALRGRARAGST